MIDRSAKKVREIVWALRGVEEDIAAIQCYYLQNQLGADVPAGAVEILVGDPAVARRATAEKLFLQHECQDKDLEEPAFTELLRCLKAVVDDSESLHVFLKDRIEQGTLHDDIVYHMTSDHAFHRKGAAEEIVADYENLLREANAMGQAI